jgi:hypothetical protein
LQVVDVPLALDCAFHDGICGKMTRSAMLSLKVLKKLVFKTETEVFKVEDSSLNTIMRADFKLNRHVATSIKMRVHIHILSKVTISIHLPAFGIFAHSAWQESHQAKSEIFMSFIKNT